MVGAAGFQNFGVQHQLRQAAVIKGNDAFGHADHVGGQPHALIGVGVQGVQKILRGLQVGFGGGGTFLPQKDHIANNGLYHGVILLYR